MICLTVTGKSATFYVLVTSASGTPVVPGVPGTALETERNKEATKRNETGRRERQTKRDGATERRERRRRRRDGATTTTTERRRRDGSDQPTPINNLITVTQIPVAPPTCPQPANSGTRPSSGRSTSAVGLRSRSSGQSEPRALHAVDSSARLSGRAAGPSGRAGDTPPRRSPRSRSGGPGQVAVAQDGAALRLVGPAGPGPHQRVAAAAEDAHEGRGSVPVGRRWDSRPAAVPARVAQCAATPQASEREQEPSLHC